MWWANMASTTPGARMPSRTSQFTSTPPSNSVTCASSSTCGPWEMIHAGVPNWAVTSTAEQFAQSQRAGEDHRRQHLGAAVAAEVAEHRQPGIGGMGGGGPHRVLHGLCPRRGGARAGEVDVEQQRGGEVADQRVDVGVQRPGARRAARSAGTGRWSTSAPGHWRRSAASVIAGVTPRAWARENRASRVAGSSQCQRRVL